MDKGSWKHSLLVLLALLCSAGMCSYWSHLNRNWGGSANSQTAIRTDLFAQWYGTREVLLHHRDPYSDDVTRELQTAYYGQSLGITELSDLRHQQRFAYPLYVIFLLAPVMKLPYHTVEIIAGIVLAALTALCLLLWMRSVRLSLPAWQLTCLAILFFTSIPVLQVLDLLQLAVFVAAALAAAAAFATSGHLVLAGGMLALATIKPQLSVLPVMWFIVWALADWRKRRFLVASFTTVLVALILASALIMPKWLIRFPLALSSYARHTHSNSLLGLLLPAASTRLSTIALIIVGLYTWRRLRRHPAESTQFALALALSLTLSTLIVPATVQPFNSIVLLPVWLLAIQRWRDLRSGTILWRSLPYLCWGLGLLSWPLALAVTIGRTTPKFAFLQRAWFMPVNASLAMPFAALGLVLLFLSRSDALQAAVDTSVALPPKQLAESSGP